MKPYDDWIQGAGYKKQDMRYKEEGIPAGCKIQREL
jgi:hypothetical protein